MRPPPLVVAFAAFGVVWGAWQAALFDLAAHYELTSGPLGTILTAGFAVTFPVMLAAGRLIDRIGARRAIIATAGVTGAGLALVGLLPPVPGLMLSVVLFTSGSGAYDVAVNGAAMADTHWSRPARLTMLHAAFSAGGVMGAIGAGALLAAGVPVAAIYPLAAAIFFACSLAPGSVRRGVPGVPRAPIAFGLSAIVPLALLAALAFLAEGSLETWSGIYVRDSFGAAALVGALGPAAFHAATLVGRLFGAGVAATLGPRGTLLVAAVTIVAGMLVALSASVAPVAIAGMAVAALGASFVVPVVVSLTAGRAGAGAGRAASYVLGLGYAGFLIGPSLVGLLGEAFGIRAALLVVPVVAIVIGAASRAPIARDVREVA
jgi:MFS family permease